MAFKGMSRGGKSWRRQKVVFEFFLGARIAEEKITHPDAHFNKTLVSLTYTGEQ
jgi:hypothetical protein